MKSSIMKSIQKCEPEEQEGIKAALQPLLENVNRLEDFYPILVDVFEIFAEERQSDAAKYLLKSVQDKIFTRYWFENTQTFKKFDKNFFSLICCISKNAAIFVIQPKVVELYRTLKVFQNQMREQGFSPRFTPYNKLWIADFLHVRDNHPAIPLVGVAELPHDLAGDPLLNCVNALMAKAADNNDLKLADYLLNKYPHYAGSSLAENGGFFDIAITDGHLDLIKGVLNKFPGLLGNVDADNHFAESLMHLLFENIEIGFRDLDLTDDENALNLEALDHLTIEQKKLLKNWLKIFNHIFVRLAHFNDYHERITRQVVALSARFDDVNLSNRVQEYYDEIEELGVE